MSYALEMDDKDEQTRFSALKWPSVLGDQKIAVNCNVYAAKMAHKLDFHKQERNQESLQLLRSLAVEVTFFLIGV